mmetsp:Transcript_12640/g.43898  ORF Transcript_12640/g.43898 Transcript_12640/m.43898 type:complete len:315 (-) Transcript_12640:63-1007(-)
MPSMLHTLCTVSSRRGPNLLSTYWFSPSQLYRQSMSRSASSGVKTDGLMRTMLSIATSLISVESPPLWLSSLHILPRVWTSSVYSFFSSSLSSENSTMKRLCCEDGSWGVALDAAGVSLAPGGGCTSSGAFLGISARIWALGAIMSFVPSGASSSWAPLPVMFGILYVWREPPGAVLTTSYTSCISVSTSMSPLHHLSVYFLPWPYTEHLSWNPLSLTLLVFWPRSTSTTVTAPNMLFVCCMAVSSRRASLARSTVESVAPLWQLSHISHLAGFEPSKCATSVHLLQLLVVQYCCMAAMALMLSSLCSCCRFWL